MSNERKEKRNQRINNGRSNFWAFLFLFTLLSNQYFSGRSEARLKESNQMIKDYRKEKTALIKQQNLLRFILRSDDYDAIVLKGTAKATTAMTAIYYNDVDKCTYVDILKLPTPLPDKRYQLWAVVEEEYVDVGLIDEPFNTGRLRRMAHIENAQAFTISLESETKRAITPTLEEIYVRATP